MSALPLISCIMPTANRRDFVPGAIQWFQRQDYPEKELVILDDGEDAVGDLIPDDPRVRYLREPQRRVLGAKRNALCEAARGELIVHWDDDDWHAPNRLSLQVAALRESDVCGSNHLLFYGPASGRAWEYRYPAGQRTWVCGSTLAYRRAFWERHRFAPVRQGEDAYFVWSRPAPRLEVLDAIGYHVGMIHGRNASPKRVQGHWWREISPERIRLLLGADLDAYTADSADADPGRAAGAHSPSAPSASRPAISPIRSATPATAAPTPAARAVKNLFACLVHESPDCILDLVRNLRYHDPESTILLYNGGRDPHLLNGIRTGAAAGLVVHPSPRPMQWGRLHDFALDCMRLAIATLDFDTMTIVDSDQLCLQRDYSAHLGAWLAGKSGIGLLGNNATAQGPRTRIPPAATAWQEVQHWRPFLRRFPVGEQAWVHWSFWPSTIFTADACRALVDLFDGDEQLQSLLSRSRLWATEEVLFPTLTVLLGMEVHQSPFSYDYCQYRRPWTSTHLRAALARSNAFWMHPVPRQRDHPVRIQLRDQCNAYRNTAMSDDHQDHGLFLTLPLLERMRRIDGWLEDDEADLLIAGTQAACRLPDGPQSVVEVGSYCGRSTVVLGTVLKTVAKGAKVYAIDPHDGQVGAADQHIEQVAPSYERFLRNIAEAGVADCVEPIRDFSWRVDWQRPVGLLFVDGLHDYNNVERDFRHFEPWLVPGAYIAFHDYADYYPGVQRFVHELIETGRYAALHCARSLMLLQRKAAEERVNALRAVGELG